MSYLKPLLPFSTTSPAPPSSTASSTPYSSLHSSPTSTKSFYSELKRQDHGSWPPLPPRRVWFPLFLFVIAGYAFVSNFQALAPTTTYLDNELDRGGGAGAGGAGELWSPSPHTEEEMQARWKRATEPLPIEATTLERLDEWENTLREVEAGEWVEKNLEVRR